MLFYIILGISLFLIALIIRFYRNAFYALAENSVALVNEFLSAAEEEVKIKQIQKKTNRLTLSLLKMLLIIVLAFALGGLIVVVYGYFVFGGLSTFDFGSFYSILSISIGATLAFVIPIGTKIKSDYSELSQLLHRMGLNNYNISNKLFKREVKKYKKGNNEQKREFVIISGLARAGTTSLMNNLAQIDEFKSLSYANMPFLMSPNLWAKFYKPKNNKVKERSHKDGIMIGLDSNEALEEYFFKVKANDSFINDSQLSEYQITKENYDEYLDYQAIIKQDDEKIYLAKNNNFILRYKSVREYNDDFIMVVLYRDPLTHASSLMEKHKDYIKLQDADPFVLEYMNWLGHHEFGKNQKPFIFDSFNVSFSDSKNDINFWLQSWINYYNYALSLEHKNTIFVNYDDFCANPVKVIQQIVGKTSNSIDVPEYKPFINKRKAEINLSDNALYNEANEIYKKLNLQ